MSSYQLSGKDAFAAGLTGVQSWNATRSVTDSAHSHSGVAGATDVLQGSSDDTFSLSGVGFEPGLFPTGNSFSIQLVKSNTVPKLSLIGSAFVESLQITIDKENPGNPIAWTISGGAHGGFTKSSTGVADTEVYSAGSGRSLDVTIDDDSVTSGTAYGSCIKSVVMNFKRPLSTYHCGGQTFRIAGNLEASITLNLFESNPYLITDAVGRAPTVVVVDGGGDLGTWELSKVRWGASAGPDPNRTTNAATSVSFTGLWLATPGYITAPSGDMFNNAS